jgi:hypothetical protein
MDILYVIAPNVAPVSGSAKRRTGTVLLELASLAHSCTVQSFHTSTVGVTAAHQ